ncbi:MAG: HEPN domain-containing protein [Microcystaceae cyanobacterium]
MNYNQDQFLKKAEYSLEVSHYLYQGGYYDFAVARAYYTMFYLASALLAGQNLQFSKHSAVIAAFGKYFVKTGEISPLLHRYLIEAQDLRHLGDYGDVNLITASEAKLQIDRSEFFLTLIRDKLL